MEKIKVNKNSFWYSLAKTGGYQPWDENLNICSFRRKVAVGAAICLFFTVLLVSFYSVFSYLITGLTIDYFAITSYWLIGGIALVSPIVFFACALLTVFSLMSVTSGMGRGYKKLRWKIRSKKEKKPSVISEMYNSWKEKYCTPIEIVED